MHTICVTICVLLCVNAFSQSNYKAIIKDKETQEPLPGATAVIRSLSIGASADVNGLVEIQNVPDGEHTIEVRFVGYASIKVVRNFPQQQEEPEQLQLEPLESELDEIVVSSTRNSRTFADISTRIEFIAGEELEEKANMKPGDIRMLLNESTGIQTQQTSATTANASIRIQGLDGRYTQILKDGFPLYAGFSAGLGLLQTPPLDLKQVEVIKGSSSTLYGGGAIAGMVNLISKEPTDERELRFLVNGTSAGGLDLNGFYGQQFGKAGVTLFLSRNTNEPYDPADIDLTAIPKFERYTVNPKLFYKVTDKTNLVAGFNFTTENRIGGDIHYIEGQGNAAHTYFEENLTDRYSTQFSLTHRFNERNSLSIRNSVSHYDRTLTVPGYVFDGVQNGTFSEINYITARKETEWMAGANLWTDRFNESVTTATPPRDYEQITIGAFIQNNTRLSEQWQLESGLRADHVIDYGWAVLPRISIMFNPTSFFSSRLGGGFGYKPPTIFTEESERIQFQNVLPISPEVNKLERSYGANWDFNYRTSIADGRIGLSANHLFFYTYLDDPLFLSSTTSGGYQFLNLPGYTDSWGTETNIKVDYGHFKLFVGYTFTNTKIHENGNSRTNPLTPRHRLNNVLLYEVEEKWKIGLEAYYFSEQVLGDGSFGRSYWINGLMIEKIWERLSLFINFENFLDTRQTRFGPIYTGPITDPVFNDIFAPVDGFVINGGVKLNL